MQLLHWWALITSLLHVDRKTHACTFRIHGGTPNLIQRGGLGRHLYVVRAGTGPEKKVMNLQPFRTMLWG